MVTNQIAPGYKHLHVSITKEEYDLLDKNVSKRKRGEAVGQMIREKYPSITGK